MARYQIMYWKEFPAQVKAEDGTDVVKAMLPERFEQAIDAAAMAEGSIDDDDYLAAWRWGPEEEREGSAQEVLDAVVVELEEAFSKDRLAEMVKALKQE